MEATPAVEAAQPTEDEMLHKSRDDRVECVLPPYHDHPDLTWSKDTSVMSFSVMCPSAWRKLLGDGRATGIQCYFSMLYFFTVLFWVLAVVSVPALVFNGVGDGLVTSETCTTATTHNERSPPGLFNATDFSTSFLRFRLATTLLNVRHPMLCILLNTSCDLSTAQTLQCTLTLLT